MFGLIISTDDNFAKSLEKYGKNNSELLDQRFFFILKIVAPNEDL
jgi:hypothetical protein